MFLVPTLFELIVLFFFTRRIHQFYKNYHSDLARYLRNMSLLGGIGLSVYALMDILFLLMNIFLAGDFFVFSVLHAIGGSIILFSFVYGMTAFFYMTFPDISSKKVLFGGSIFFILILLFRFIFFPLPLVWVDAQGTLRFKLPFFANIISILWAVAGLFPLAVACAREAFKKRGLRLRSGFLALALFLIVIATTLFSLELIPGGYEFSSVARIAGFIMLALAAFSRTEKEISPSSSQ